MSFILFYIHVFMAFREFREHVKDLSCISTNFCRIVIVDNNPFSFLLQPVNGIPCIPFSAGQPYDAGTLNRFTKLITCQTAYYHRVIFRSHVAFPFPDVLPWTHQESGARSRLVMRSS
ncbi:putative FCP1 domain, HAD superfamily protein [Helianthus annuus]|uniref:FCP1 domain, HAD superfamily protein n=1 Tax=Helianthus annuus TaxID=4232 RepID=A0A9K3NC86_HELAN|nr:putative FCP1 domain, HAD superfamily protein [Helianthus annuus]